MFSKCLKLFRSVPVQSKTLRVAVRGHQNYVKSNELSRMEQECDTYCKIPRIPPQKVCVVGAGSNIGKIVCLLLKQQKIIKILSMYDDDNKRGMMGAASDLSHIDTSTSVEAYIGRTYLKDAVNDSDVVLVCGGHNVLPPCCNTPERDLFMSNLQFVRSATLAAAQFAPHAILAVGTPPVDANFALAAYTMKVLRSFDSRRVMGVNSLSSMRANQLISTLTNEDPRKSQVPVICGTGRCTRVPVFSALKNPRIPQSQIEHLTRLIREADDIICKVKSNNEDGHLSGGFASARFVVNIMKGLFEGQAFIDSALVWQSDPGKAYGLQMCATPVSMGRNGISAVVLPQQLSPTEEDLLNNSKCELLDLLNLGRCAALGEDFCYHNCKFRPPCLPSPPCKPCTA